MKMKIDLYEYSLNNEEWVHKQAFEVEEEDAMPIIIPNLGRTPNIFYKFVTDKGHYIYTVNPCLFDEVIS
jgi:hypothetical protein